MTSHQQAEQHPADAEAQPASGATARKRFGLLSSRKKVRRRELVAFTRELSTLLESGVSVVPALELLREERRGTALGPIIDGLVTDLGAGLPLADAMEKHPEAFNRVFVWTVRASDRGAPIVQSLQQAAKFLEMAESTVAQAKRAMIYPAMVLGIGIAVTFLMITTALPPMIELLQRLDSDLPLPTRILMVVSNALTAYKMPLLLGAPVVLIGLMRYVKTPGGRLRLHRLLLRVPVVSVLLVQGDVARAAGAMALLTESGLPLPEALEVAAQTVSNEVIRAALLESREGLMSGEGLAAPLAATGVLPATFTHSLKVAEETGTLDANLKRMADFYQRESSESLKALVGVIEPLSTIGVGLMVGFIALAVIMPMYSSLGALK